MKTTIEQQQEIIDLKKQVLEFEKEALKRAKKIIRWSFCITIVSIAIATILWLLQGTENSPYTSYETITIVLGIVFCLVGITFAIIGDVWRTKKLVCEHKVHQATCELNFAEYDLENMRK